MTGCSLLVVFMLLSGYADEHGHERHEKKKPEMPLPEIPGITIKDEKPNGCVDCHKNYPEYKKDGRLSTSIKEWATEGVEQELVDIARTTATKKKKIKGKHPDISKSMQKQGAKIPTLCLHCHEPRWYKKLFELVINKEAPPFEKMIHTIHLTGKENHFLSKYKGYCTHCHAMDVKTGEMSLKIGAEQ